MTNEERRLRRLESMVEEIHALLVMGRVSTPGDAEYDLALEELAQGNNKPLAMFLRRGGKIPLRHTAPAAGQAKQTNEERRSS